MFIPCFRVRVGWDSCLGKNGRETRFWTSLPNLSIVLLPSTTRLEEAAQRPQSFNYPFLCPHCAVYPYPHTLSRLSSDPIASTSPPLFPHAILYCLLSCVRSTALPLAISLSFFPMVLRALLRERGSILVIMMSTSPNTVPSMFINEVSTPFLCWHLQCLKRLAVLWFQWAGIPTLSKLKRVCLPNHKVAFVIT